uniref:metalloprotease TldD n=1 Tax=Pararhizobium sp. IMCC3301 TaxID=3067904 RepID=UPI002741013A|nr:metalloprotease TldD [Pararhizobium sp. IMCC3301]
MSLPQSASYFEGLELESPVTRRHISDALTGSDDGELFAEYRQQESLSFDNGRLKSATFDVDQGFGLRSVCGEAVGYAHSSELSDVALARAVEAVSAVGKGYSGHYADAPMRTNRKLYGEDNPLSTPQYSEKIALLETVDAYARDSGSDIAQVSTGLAASWQIVKILRADGHLVEDIRPMLRFNVSVIARDGARQETGSFGFGGRDGFDAFINEEAWKAGVDDAVRQARVNLTAEAAPAGEMNVVLGPGWPGILLHEAVGHGLEGDFNRKGTSAFATLMGEQVASKGVTIVDDGTLAARRGSLSVDDEGTPTSRTVLIEDGKLVGYMQDRQNARLSGVVPTGNGRRQSYAHAPMPRMTNTCMLGGQDAPEEIIASLKDGLYAVSFGGGQVDITSGKFVFSCTEAYRVKNGKIGAPVKGAMLIGNGPDAMRRVSMIGNDMQLDRGVGTCGKAGQWVPVGVGQPTLRIDAITVGGTQTAKQ